MITKEVSDRLGYYVYALVDPRNKQIFYIGKGKGNRVFEYALGIKSNEEAEDDSEKIALIKEILSAKQEVNKCHYTLGVVNGIVRGIYPCFNAWRATKPEEVSKEYPQDAFRYCFDKVDALDEAQFQQLKSDLVGKRIKGLHKGQNAIAYFDSLNKK